MRMIKREGNFHNSTAIPGEIDAQSNLKTEPRGKTNFLEPFSDNCALPRQWLCNLNATKSPDCRSRPTLHNSEASATTGRRERRNGHVGRTSYYGRDQVHHMCGSRPKIGVH